MRESNRNRERERERERQRERESFPGRSCNKREKEEQLCSISLSIACLTLFRLSHFRILHDEDCALLVVSIAVFFSTNEQPYVTHVYNQAGSETPNHRTGKIHGKGMTHSSICSGKDDSIIASRQHWNQLRGRLVNSSSPHNLAPATAFSDSASIASTQRQPSLT